MNVVLSLWFGLADYQMPLTWNFFVYGVGISTEREYAYKLSPSAECYIAYISFQIDNEDEDACLTDRVYDVGSDETVPN